MTVRALLLNNRPLGSLIHPQVTADTEDNQLHVITHRFGIDDIDDKRFLHPVVTDVRDEDTVYEIARWMIQTHRIGRVMSVTERFMSLAARLRAEFGLPGLQPDVTASFRDKVVMKTLLRSAGVRIPYFAPIESKKSITDFFASHDRVVLKHRFGVGGNEVYEVDGPADAIDRWQSLGAGVEEYELEEFIDGPMYHCDAVVDGHEVRFAAVSRYLSNPGDFRTRRFAGSAVVPGGQLRDRIVQLNERVIRALGLDHGVTHLEVFHTGDDELVVCEIAARPGGGDIHQGIRDTYGVDLFAAAMRLELGLAAALPPKPQEDPNIVRGNVGIYPVPGRLESLPASPRFDWITDSRVHVSIGDELAPPKHCTDYLARFWMTAPDAATFDERVATLVNHFTVRTTR